MPTSKVQLRYRKAVKKHLKPFYANWMPGQERALGDYGTFKKGIFIRLGNIKDFGISFDEKIDNSLDDHNFSEGGSYSMQIIGGATAGDVGNASVEFKLESKSTVYFQALDAQSNEIENKVELGKRLIEGLKNGSIEWNKKWVIITELVDAGRTIAAVALENGASFELKADVNVPAESLMTDASVELGFTKTKNVGYQVSGQKMQILLGLSRVKGWFKPTLQPERVGIRKSTIEDMPIGEPVFEQFTDDIDAIE